MTADAPPTAVCPRCKHRTPTRQAPSGAVRLTRHDQPADHPTVEAASCPGSGQEIGR